MELRTPRLSLRATEPQVFDELWAAIEGSLTELELWLPWAADPDPEQTRIHTADAEREWNEGDERHFTIWYEDAVAGAISIQTVRRLFRRAELGYWMRTDLCSRGLMTEAASAVIAFGFDEMNLHRIELHAALENTASVRVAEKLGFTSEGVLRDGSRGVHGFHDCHMFALLSSDRRPKFHL